MNYKSSESFGRSEYTPIQREILQFAFSVVDKCNPTNKSRHVAIITTKSGIILCYGLNDESSRRPHNVSFFKNGVHAEWRAIKRFQKLFSLGDLSKVNLWSIRITRRGEVKNAKPCECCSNFLKVYKPKRVYYSDDEGNFQIG